MEPLIGLLALLGYCASVAAGIMVGISTKEKENQSLKDKIRDNGFNVHP